MKALLLRLSAPLQAWGTQSRFSERDTQLEPSKSGVVGLLAAALGWPRTADLSSLAALGMAVRVDREGRKIRDFHTVGGGNVPREILTLYGVREYGVSKANDSSPDAAISNRYYLADARFLVAVGSEDEALLHRLAGALRSPVHPLFLGRKSCVPAEPVLHDRNTPLRQGESLRAILEEEPWQPWDPVLGDRRRPWPNAPDKLRLVLESPDGSGAARSDIPISFQKGNRRHALRSVVVEFTDKPIQQWKATQQQVKEVAS